MMARFLVMALKILICTENGVAFFTHHNLLVAAIDAVLCELALLWELLTAGNTRKYPLRLLWFRLLLLLDWLICPFRWPVFFLLVLIGIDMVWILAMLGQLAVWEERLLTRRLTAFGYRRVAITEIDVVALFLVITQILYVIASELTKVTVVHSVLWLLLRQLLLLLVLLLLDLVIISWLLLLLLSPAVLVDLFVLLHFLIF
jgi:hypothetical protein